MGDFHNRLVQARRDGVAPGQLPPSTETDRPTADVAVTFRPPSDGVPLVCSGCGGLIDAGAVPVHVDWHRRQQ